MSFPRFLNCTNDNKSLEAPYTNHCLENLRKKKKDSRMDLRKGTNIHQDLVINSTCYTQYPANLFNYLFKVSNREIRKRCEISSKLTIKTLEQRQWRRSGAFIVNFEHISHIFSASTVDFEEVNVSWVRSCKATITNIL